MAMGFVEFQLRVESYDKVMLWKEGGGEKSAKISFAPCSRKIARFENLLRAGQVKRSKDFRELGKLLYQYLFREGVASAFQVAIKNMEKAWGNCQDGENPSRLRLQLVFAPDASELAGVPWEFLYYPGDENDDGFFLVDHPNLVLSRYVPLQEERSSLSIKEDSLRFLVVISEPKLEPPKRVISEPVVKAIERLKTSYAVCVEKLKNPTPQELQTAIDDIKPHILHFIGHGQFNWQEQRGELALLKSDSETPPDEREIPCWVTDETFANYFRRFKPRLVLLQACQGGEVDFSANYAGLAPQLTRKGIPAVVAMQYPVCNGVASTFSLGFYQALARGEPVDVAVQEGRREVVRLNSEDFYSTRDFGTPVLYMNSTDGDIMPRPRVLTKFTEEDLLNSSDKLEAALNEHFNQEELLNLAIDLNAYGELKEANTQQEQAKKLVKFLNEERDVKSLVDAIKDEKPDAFN